MMRFMKLTMLLAGIAATGQLYALTVDDDRDAATVPEAEPPQGKGKPTAGTGTRPSAKPQDTFKPSERIGADSAVSFPVDI